MLTSQCHPKKGFVLLTVMILLHLIAMLSLYMLMKAQNQIKFSEDKLQRFIKKNTIKNMLNQLESAINPRCLHEPIAATTLKNRSFKWWIHHACGGMVGAFEIFYFYERLGKDSCAFIRDEMIADYYRLTLMLLTKRDVTDKIIWQRTLAIATPKGDRVCRGHPYYLKLGYQMSREL